jgi:ABC-type uncharacterized transport system fused permease/ATPase subunit
MVGTQAPLSACHAGEVGANPDQYMQADARQLAELTAMLGFGLLQSSLLLVSNWLRRRSVTLAKALSPSRWKSDRGTVTTASRWTK